MTAIHERQITRWLAEQGVSIPSGIHGIEIALRIGSPTTITVYGPNEPGQLTTGPDMTRDKSALKWLRMAGIGVDRCFAATIHIRLGEVVQITAHLYARRETCDGALPEPIRDLLLEALQRA